MNILLFDLAVAGHHYTYIFYLVRHWCENSFKGKLYILVSPEFINKYPELISFANNYLDSNIQFLAITHEEYHTWQNSSNLWKKIFFEWNLFCKYADKLSIDHATLMYLDHLQLPIAIKRNSPCSFSGIYFRPTFHYDTFENYRPSFKDKIRSWRQKLLLFQVLKNPKFKRLLCLDPFVVPIVNEQSQYSKALHLADPIEVKPVNQQSLQKLKEELSIDNNKTIYLLFGKLDRRKGIYQILDAMESLSENIAKKTTLLLIGEIATSEKEKIISRIKQIKKNSLVEIIFNNQFVSEDEVHLYFHLADVILAIYPKHIGMSGILLQAAAANKPVICSDNGLMGKIAKTYEMGMVIDGTKSSNIKTCIEENNDNFSIKYDKLKALIDDNNYQNYCEKIFHHLSL